jgi:hypothetical protein
LVSYLLLEIALIPAMIDSEVSQAHPSPSKPIKPGGGARRKKQIYNVVELLTPRNHRSFWILRDGKEEIYEASKREKSSAWNHDLEFLSW